MFLRRFQVFSLTRLNVRHLFLNSLRHCWHKFEENDDDNDWLIPESNCKQLQQELQQFIGAIPQRIPQITSQLSDEAAEELASVANNKGLLGYVRERPGLYVIHTNAQGIHSVASVQRVLQQEQNPLHSSTPNSFSPSIAVRTLSPELESLRPFLPFSFFISVQTLLDSPQIPFSEPQSLLTCLSERSEFDLDVRNLGDSADTTYFRAIGNDGNGGVSHMPYDATVEQGDDLFSTWNPLPLASTLFQQLGGKGSIPLENMPTLLGPTLAKQLPLQGAASLLVFDRLQHLFKVDSDNWTVEAREDSSRVEFNLITTPTPQIVRFLLTHLTSPTPLTHLYQQLPNHLRQMLTQTFGTLESFVAAHQLLFFIRSPDLLCTPRMIQERLAIGQTSLDTETAEMLKATAAREVAHYALPRNRAISLKALVPSLPGHVQMWISRKQPRRFFDLHPQYFSVFALAHPASLVVQHAQLPRPHNALPSLVTRTDALREVARLTLKPRSLPRLCQLMSREAFTLLGGKVGTLNSLRKRPDMFCVEEDSDCVVIAYWGHLPREE